MTKNEAESIRIDILREHRAWRDWHYLSIASRMMEVNWKYSKWLKDGPHPKYQKFYCHCQWWKR